MEKPKITVALAGCGRIVEEGHIQGYRACADQATVAALADPSAERREKIGTLARVPPNARYADVASMLAKERFNILVVATPPDLHASVIQTAALHGVGVICEKPLCRSAAESRQVQDFLIKHKTFFAVLHNYLEQAGWRYLIDFVNAGEIGSPGFLILNEMAQAPWATYSEGRVCWRTLQGSGGGPLWENLYHACYLSEAVHQSSVVSAFSSGGALLQPYEAGDTAMLILEHANGSKSFAMSTWGYTGRESAFMEVVGADGVVRYNYWEEPPALDLMRGGWESRIIAQSPQSEEDWGYASAFRNAFDAFIKGQSPRFGIDEAVRMVSILSAACQQSSNRALTSEMEFGLPQRV